MATTTVRTHKRRLTSPAKRSVTAATKNGATAPPGREGEIAFSDPRRLFPNGYYSPYNPSALVRGRGLTIFDLMRRDDQVKAALAFKKHTVTTTGWTVTSPEGMPEDWDVTRFVREVLTTLDPTEVGGGTLDLDLYEILSALDYGYSVTEKVWSEIEDGEWTGMIGLQALKTRAPHFFTFAQDEYGNIEPDGVVQRMNSKIPDGRMPREKFVLFTYQAQFGNPYGVSDLEAAYFPWWVKDNAMKWLAMLLERLGIPPIFGLYDPNRYSPAQIDDLKTVLTNLQAATFGVIPKPGGTSGQGNETLSFWAPEIAGQATRVFIPSLEFLNGAISRALLMPALIGMTNDTSQGSFARSRVHFDVFMLVVEGLRKDVEQVVMMHQVIKPLVDLNYPGVKDYPQWRFMPLTDQGRFETFKLWTDLVAGNIALQQDDDEKLVRRALKMPEKRGAAVKPGPPAGGGTPQLEPTPKPADEPAVG